MPNLILASLLLALPLGSAAPQDGALAERLRSAVSREASALEGLSVAIAVGDEFLLSEGHGYADAARAERATGQTRWRAGALYPTLTALALLRLVEQQRLSLEDPLARFLPGLDFGDDRILVRHILQHTSGLPSYVGWHEARNEDTPIDPRAELEWLAAQPLDAHPGHCFQWSNANALVAGLLVEAIGEAPLSDQLERALFEPLGLEDSGFDGVDIPIRRAVHACYEVAGQVESDCHAFLPFRAEGLFTTAPDLVRLARGMAGRKIVDEGSWSELLRPTRGEDGDETPWSLGLGLVALDGHRGLTFGGGFGGDRAHVAYYPDFDLSIAVLAAGSEAPVAEIERRLARLVMDLPEPGIHDLPVSPEDVGTYVGDYYLGCTRLVIFPAQGSLWLGTPGEPDVRLRYQGRYTFVRDDDPQVQLVFLIEEPGARAHAFLLVARGAQSVARRID